MERKQLLGIFGPLSVIFVLVILSSLEIGFSSKKKTESAVSLNSLFSYQGQLKNNIVIETITITNDFFMPKRYGLPIIVACLNDREGLKMRESMQVRYSEGSYFGSSGIPLYSDMSYNNYGVGGQSVEISAYGKKDIRIMIEPRMLYNEIDESDYRDYDELLLIEPKGSYSYSYCEGLSSEEMESATRIALSRY